MLLIVPWILAAFVLSVMLMVSFEKKVFPTIEVLLARIGLRITRADDMFDILVVAVQKDFVWICCGSFLVVILGYDLWQRQIEYLRASGRELCRGQ